MFQYWRVLGILLALIGEVQAQDVLGKLFANYKAPQGTMTAQVSGIPLNMQFTIGDLPPQMASSWLQQLDSAEIENLGLKKDLTQIGLSANYVEWLSTKQNVQLEGTKLECKGDLSKAVDINGHVAACLLGSISAQVEELKVDDHGSALKLAVFLVGESEQGQKVKLKDVSLQAKNNKFSFVGANSILGIKVKIKLAGLAEYQEANKLLAVRLDQAKWGILNVRDKIFKELAAQSLPGVKVQKPFIYISL